MSSLQTKPTEGGPKVLAEAEGLVDKLQRLSLFCIGVAIILVWYLKNKSENQIRELYSEGNTIPLWFFRSYYANCIKLWAILFVSFVGIIILVVLLADIFSTRTLQTNKNNETTIETPIPKTFELFLEEVKKKRMIIWIITSSIFIVLFTAVFNTMAIDVNRLTDLEYIINRNKIYYYLVTIGIISIGIVSYLYINDSNDINNTKSNIKNNKKNTKEKEYFTPFKKIVNKYIQF